MEKRNAIFELISNLDAADLSYAIEVVKMRRRTLDSKAKYQFKVGDEVWFNAKARGIIRGRIESFGPKNIKVKSTTGMKWTVSPTLLRTGEIDYSTFGG